MLTEGRFRKIAALPATLEGLGAGPMAVEDARLVIALARQQNDALTTISKGACGKKDCPCCSTDAELADAARMKK